jgi:hypothetical protein
VYKGYSVNADTTAAVVTETTGKNEPDTNGSQGQKVLDLITLWLADDSGYDEQVWPLVKEAIEENRLSDRERFCD